MSNRFTPVFPGVPRHRLPWRSVYVPVIPCVLDGCISLLELISKLEYIISQYSAAIEGNHTDIINLAAYIDDLETDLRAYIDAQDAVTLESANAYTDTAVAELNAAIAALREYVDDQDAATLASARAYADSAVSTLRAYVDAQLALKLDVSRVTDDITEDSTDVITSGAVYGLLQAIDDAKPVYINVTIDPATGTVTPASPSAFAEAMAYANAGRPSIVRATSTTAQARVDLLFFQLAERVGSTELIYSNYLGTISATASGWTYTIA